MSVAEVKTPAGFDIEKVRADFPILAQESHGKRLAFLDSAASAQKPQAVIDALRNTYETCYANIHRGVYELSQRTTDAHEAAREKLARFINAKESSEIVFVRGTTEAVNLVAQTYGRANIGPDDAVVISEMEHHSNIVPWQLLRDKTGLQLRIAPINDDGELIFEEYERLLDDKVKLVAMTHMSNALGTIVPIKEAIAAAHAQDIPVLVDGAQAAPHLNVDVQDIDADFYAFSGHKMYGPSGIGVLYGKKELLESMPPYQGGGEMITEVTFERTQFAKVPHKFEAGTPNIAGAIGLGAAVDYLNELDRRAIEDYENELLEYGTYELSRLNSVRLIGTARAKSAVLSFVLDDVHAHDVGTILDHHGVAVRAGHHCAQPVMDHFDVPATVRASLGLYNNSEDIDQLIEAVKDVQRIFAS